MRLWRIATDTPDYSADDLSGAGARITGGRWNRAGTAVVYAATSASLACLETIVHLGVGDLPLNRYLVALDVPEPLWRARIVHTPASLPVGWDAVPPGIVSLDIGDRWLASRASALMEVPSAIVPEDTVVLLNPQHPQAAGVGAVKLRKWMYDSRVRPAPRQTPVRT